MLDDEDIDEATIDQHSFQVIDGPRLLAGYADPHWPGVFREPWESEDLAFETPKTKRRFVIRLSHEPEYMRSSKWLMNFLKGENQSGAAGVGEMNGEYACTKNGQYKVDETNAGFAEPGLPPTPFSPREVSRPLLKRDALVPRPWLDGKSPYCEKDMKFDAWRKTGFVAAPPLLSTDLRGKRRPRLLNSKASFFDRSFFSRHGLLSQEYGSQKATGGAKRAGTSFYLDCTTQGSTSEGNTFSPPADTEQEAKAGRLADPPQSAADGIFLPTEQKRHERLFEWDVHDEHNSRKKKIYQLNHADF